VVLLRSPGGIEENTGNASAFNDRETMGLVEVISTNPVKLWRFSIGPMLAAPCAIGPSVMFEVPNRAPVLLMAVNVTTADCVDEGLAYATPVAVWAKVTKLEEGSVEGFTAASPRATPELLKSRYNRLA
jgi:hypothetical protein